MNKSYYTKLRPFYSSPPTQRFRFLASALYETCHVLQQYIQSFCALPPLQDKNQVTNTHAICQIIRQTIEQITRGVSTDQISPDTITEEQLYSLKFDLYAGATGIRAAVAVLKNIVHHDIRPNHAHYALVLTQCERAADDIRDVVEALYSSHERETL